MGRSWQFITLKVLVSVSLLALIVQHFSWADLQQQVRDTDPIRLLLPLGIITLSNLLGALQWGWVIRSTGVVIRSGEVIQLYFSGLFFNNFLFGTLGGDVYKIYSLGRQQNAISRVAGATIVDRLVGVSALCALALVTAIWEIARGEMPWAMAALTLFFCFGLMTLSGVILHDRMGSLVERWVGKVKIGGLGQKLEGLLRNLRDFRRRPRILNNVFMLSLVIQSARVLAHFFVALAMGWSLGWLDLGKFFLVIPILGLIIALPISIGGWGVREWAGVALWAPLGLEGEEAITLLVLTASLTFLVSMAGGLVLFLRFLRSGAQDVQAS